MMPSTLKKILIFLSTLAGLILLFFISLIAIFRWYGRNSPHEPLLPGKIDRKDTVFEDLKRSWTVYEPSTLEKNAPLVFMLPGSAMDAEITRKWTRYRLEELAERDGFLLVYAEAWERGADYSYEWNDCRKNTDQPAHNLNVNDVGFILWLRKYLIQTYSIDEKRVFAMGISDGGQMCYRLATEHPELFQAVAVMIAQQAAPENSNCLHPKGPISILIMNGTDDPIIPFHGGEASLYGYSSAGMVQSMDGTIAHWKNVNQITSEEVTDMLPDINKDDGSQVRVRRWKGTRADLAVYEIIGGGHSVPGGWTGLPPFLLGNINQDINAMDAIIDFFLK